MQSLHWKDRHASQKHGQALRSRLGRQQSNWSLGYGWYLALAAQIDKHLGLPPLRGQDLLGGESLQCHTLSNSGAHQICLNLPR